MARSAKKRLTKQHKLALLQELEQLLERLSIPLRYEKGDFRGGLCIYNRQRHFILNKRLSVDQKLQILKSDLRLLNLQEIYLRPALREFLEMED